jgi:hypothetical protein
VCVRIRSGALRALRLRWAFGSSRASPTVHLAHLLCAGGVDTLNLKEVFADRYSDDRCQHEELITCGATGMLRELLSYSRRYPRNSRILTTFSCLTNTVIRRRKPPPVLLASLLYIRLIW